MSQQLVLRLDWLARSSELRYQVTHQDECLRHRIHGYTMLARDPGTSFIVVSERYPFITNNVCSIQGSNLTEDNRVHAIRLPDIGGANTLVDRILNTLRNQKTTLQPFSWRVEYQDGNRLNIYYSMLQSVPPSVPIQQLQPSNQFQQMQNYQFQINSIAQAASRLGWTEDGGQEIACRHEYVNVGFTSRKMVCRYCDQEGE